MAQIYAVKEQQEISPYHFNQLPNNITCINAVVDPNDPNSNIILGITYMNDQVSSIVVHKQDILTMSRGPSSL